MGKVLAGRADPVLFSKPKPRSFRKCSRLAVRGVSEKEALEFDVPCCSSRRTCMDTYHAVISLKTGQVLRTIHAVRCHRLGYAPVKYKFYPSDDVILVSFYKTTRDNVRLKILWKPEEVPEDLALAVARQALVPYVEE